MTERFERGEQIAYIPLHANGELSHPDVEYGFVTSQKGDTVWCRYWRKDEVGMMLRTLANSEGTPVDSLVRHVSVRQGRVEDWLVSIERMEQLVRELERAP